MGVEIMPEAIATRDANGMATIYRDVWDGLEGKYHVPAYQLLIASPPCQTFSMAGKGAGRAALDEVLEAIELHAYKDPTQLREFGEKHDPRTALVLAPLAHVWRDRPEYVAFEQVPTVLPVWEACAEVMRDWGYEVKVEVLHAEQYGVPQTRKRAILVARLNAPVSLPTPTHSRYYQTNPSKLDPGVMKWVSMAEALGWGSTQPYPSHMSGAGSSSTVQVPRSIHAPAHTITGAGNAEFHSRTAKAAGPKQRASDGRLATAEEAALIQSYEQPFVWCGTKTKQFLQIGNAVPPLLAEAILAALLEGAA